jgi:hypothetical protein
VPACAAVFVLFRPPPRAPPYGAPLRVQTGRAGQVGRRDAICGHIEIWWWQRPIFQHLDPVAAVAKESHQIPENGVNFSCAA